MSISTRYRPGVLNVSPPDECDMPDEYYDKARAELLADRDWVLAQIEEAIEREVHDLAESLWQSDVDESQIAAADYAADSREDY